MTHNTFAIRYEGLASLVVLALALTNVSIFEIDGFRLMVFWPLFFFAVAVGLILRGRLARLPRSAAPFSIAAILMILSSAINSAVVSKTTFAFSLGWIVYWYWLTVSLGPQLAGGMERSMSRVAYVYFFALAACFLLIFAGFPESPWPDFFGWVYDVRSGRPRFYGPTTEPSYAALILGATALAILRFRNGLGLPARSWASDLVFVGILVSLLALRSVYGIVVLLLLVVAVATPAMKRPAAGLLLVFVFLFLLPAVLELMPGDTRLLRVAALMSQGRFADLQLVDNSAYLRFGPALEFFSRVSLLEMEFWIGHGAGAAERFFGDLFGRLASEDNNLMNVGFFPAYVYDYGVLPTAGVLVYLFSIAAGPFSTYTRFLIFIGLWNFNFNTNIFWYFATAVFITSPEVIKLHHKIIRNPANQPTEYPRLGAAHLRR